MKSDGMESAIPARPLRASVNRAVSLLPGAAVGKEETKSARTQEVLREHWLLPPFCCRC